MHTDTREGWVPREALFEADKAIPIPNFALAVRVRRGPPGTSWGRPARRPTPWPGPAEP